MTTAEEVRDLPVTQNLDRPMTVQEQTNLSITIHRILTEVMVKEAHYGALPGTDQPTLLQPGAEKICTASRLAPKPRVEDLSEPDNNRYRYRVHVALYTIATNLFVGEAVGECSTDEEKYQWREALSEDEWNY